MAEPLKMTPAHRPLPEEVLLRADELEVAFTPRELRMVRETLGRSWSSITADEADDDKFTVSAWLMLRREGYEVTLEDMDDVVIRIAIEEPDPTSSGPSGSSPPSADSGE